MKASQASIGGLVQPWNGKARSGDPYAALVSFLAVRAFYFLSQDKNPGRLFFFLSEALGDLLEMPIDPMGDFKEKRIKKALLQRLGAIPAHPAIYGPLATNIEWLGERLKLRDVEKAILGLGALVQQNSILDGLFSYLCDIPAPQLENLIAFMLGKSRQDVRVALAPSAALPSARLVKCRGDYAITLPEHLTNLLLQRHRKPEDLFRTFYGKPPAATLTLADFSHLGADLSLLQKILHQSVKTGRVGVNVLLYGAPGTGKTELARVLAAELGCELHEVKITDEDGDPLSGPDRLGAYAVMQKTLQRQKRTLALFDEIEDVFPSPSLWSFLGGKQETRNKAWTNRLLEENPLPAIWIANAIDGVDPAYRRRFTWEMELEAPPKAVRRRIFARHLGKLPVTPEWIDSAARDPHLVPGYIERAARVLELVHTQDPQENADVLDQMLRNGRKVAKQSNKLPEHYNLSYINADHDLQEIVRGVEQHGEIRMLFYGVPGTGKTAFARYLAEHLDRPLKSYTTADILGPLVGETEQRIAQMFAETDQDSILFLDEVDSLLQNRANADRHWEVTQVNELLQRMEQHPGVMICATNRKEGLDPAVLRRFDLQVEFQPITIDQRVRLIDTTLKTMGLADGTEEEQVTIREVAKRLEGLTPGDVAVLVRRHRFRPFAYRSVVIGYLEKIFRDKSRDKFRKIGF
ncbi:AAA family ATPase [Acidithiobacillus sp. MC6.1]|nr:AAA family ATPase [Acidithiobacillus sp. MC6.1]